MPTKQQAGSAKQRARASQRASYLCCPLVGRLLGGSDWSRPFRHPFARASHWPASRDAPQLEATEPQTCFKRHFDGGAASVRIYTVYADKVRSSAE
ncbi:hypothetical protein ISCGN_018494 [Ixodes scapularis]